MRTISFPAHDTEMTAKEEKLWVTAFQNWLPSASVLCDQSDMAKTKKNVAAVALGRLGGLRGGKARSRGGKEFVANTQPVAYIVPR